MFYQWKKRFSDDEMNHIITAAVEQKMEKKTISARTVIKSSRFELIFSRFHLDRTEMVKERCLSRSILLKKPR